MTSSEGGADSAAESASRDTMKKSKLGDPSIIARGQFKPGTKVWAILPGFKAWPSMVLEDNQISDSMWREQIPNTVPVQFFRDHNCGWIKEAGVVSLEEGTKKNKALLKQKSIKEAYDEACDETIEFYSAREREAKYLELHSPANQDDDNEEEADDSKDKSKSKSSRSRSASSRKRSAGEKDGNGKKPSKRSKRGDEERKEKTPQEKLMTLRHRLQRIFLSDEDHKDDYNKVNELMNRVENMDVTREMLMETKIAKVLKRITALDLGEKPPANVQERSRNVLDKWQQFLTANAEQEAKPTVDMTENRNPPRENTAKINDEATSKVEAFKAEDNKNKKADLVNEQTKNIKANTAPQSKAESPMNTAADSVAKSPRKTQSIENEQNESGSANGGH